MTILKKSSALTESLESLIDESWHEVLIPWLTSEKGLILFDKLKIELKNNQVFPELMDVFKPFQLTKYDKLKVVILGNEPYCRLDINNGLCYAIKKGTTPNGFSSRAILAIEECVKDGQFENSANLSTITYLKDLDYTLETWAEQGVLLLNTSLTVASKEKNSHVNIWKPFIKYVLLQLTKQDLTYIAMGSNIEEYVRIVRYNGFNDIIESVDPYIESDKFKKKYVFEIANNFLAQRREKVINWI